MYSGDECYDDDVTSGPCTDDDDETYCFGCGLRYAWEDEHDYEGCEEDHA